MWLIWKFLPWRVRKQNHWNEFYSRGLVNGRSFSSCSFSSKIRVFVPKTRKTGRISGKGFRLVVWARCGRGCTVNFLPLGTHQSRTKWWFWRSQVTKWDVFSRFLCQILYFTSVSMQELHVFRFCHFHVQARDTLAHIVNKKFWKFETLKVQGIFAFQMAGAAIWSFFVEKLETIARNARFGRVAEASHEILVLALVPWKLRKPLAKCSFWQVLQSLRTME